ncbi:chitobiase/beta-hexosaminidase C-terminal domain-containing protein, partial [Hyalangium sp.]|uniref:chitobiase/beta-hexosaminidase C-terminal domain-containing protein n=1 Tax=Hyalangium sp. TaxID=2028555 RepID=UPI002D2D35D6
MALQPAVYLRFVLALLVLHVASACGGDPQPPPPEEDTSAPTSRAEPAGGTFTSPVSVSLSCDDGGGSGCSGTHYTTDGSTPSTSSSRYSAPIALSATTTLRFFSVDAAGNSEAVKTEQYTLNLASVTVTAAPQGGTYGSAQTVTLTCSASAGSSCGSIHYTTDGSTPTTSSPAYSAPLTVSTSTTLRFFATDNLGRASAVVTETYVIDPTPPTTTASPAGGAYDSVQSVTLSCDDGTGSGCQATYYTTNGSTPTPSSSMYTGPILIDRPLTLKFFSVDRQGNAEPAKSEDYTFTTDVTPPTTTASPAGGVYPTAQNVTLTCDDGAGGSGCANTYYTTDGSTPTPSSPRYTSPISISAHTVVKFFSVDQLGNSEAASVKSVSYFIGQSPASTSAQIAAVRAAADGALNQSIELALVTYKKPPVGSDAAGFFLQAEPSGPALFVAVSPSTLNPVPSAGDRVTLVATQKATVSGRVHVTAVTGFLRNGTGESVEPLRTDVTGVDLPASVDTYESELIAIRGTLLDTFAPSGAGHVAATLSTTGTPNNSNLQLRLPNSL